MSGKLNLKKVNKQTVEVIDWYVDNSKSNSISTHDEKRTKGTEIKQLCSFEKTTNQWD